MVGKMVNPQDSYLLFPISQMKQFLDLHLDFFTWWAITMEMELKCLFLTTFLWSHLSNYLHTVTLGDPETDVCASPSTKKGVISAPLGFCTAEASRSPICQGSFQQRDETLAASHNPSQKRHSRVEKIQGMERMLKNVPSVLWEGFSVYLV